MHCLKTVSNPRSLGNWGKVMDRIWSNGVSKRDSRVSVTFWLLLLTCVLQEVSAKQCVKVDACRCMMDDGSGLVDISSLGLQNGEPRFKDVMGPNGYYYFSYNPCYGFTEKNCVNAAVCQTSVTDSYQTGDHDSATWSYDGINTQVSYETTTDTTRKTLVTLKCDHNAESPSMVSYGETGFAEYQLEVTTKCACPGVCSDGIVVTVEVSLSAGSVMVIIFFVLLFVYLVGGVIFNRVQRQATGAEMIPNASFWSSLPGLVKEGFAFTFSCVRGSGGKSGYDQV